MPDFDIRLFLDSTYLKNTEAAADLQAVMALVDEAVSEKFKLAMIRPEFVLAAKQRIPRDSKLQIGTVIDFPKGQSATAEKLREAEKAIADGADDLDFVCNYNAFLAGDTATVRNEILACTELVLSHSKTIKWIVEAAALDDFQLVQLTALIRNTIIRNFKEDKFGSVFIKSATGFYTGKDNSEVEMRRKIILMLENAFPLPVKAAGGIRNYEEAVGLIELGVKRLGTSSAKAIANGQMAANIY